MDGHKEPTLREQVAGLLNQRSMENGSNTPDFILADYLIRALEAFDNAVVERERWYGRNNEGPAF